MDNEVDNQGIADTLEEGSISLLLRPSLFREDDWIAYTLVSPGDGSKYFRAVGRTKPVSTINRLPLPRYQKPRVMEFKDEQGRWTDLRGYSVAILKELQQVLNFTISLREFEFWGTPDAKGRWDGVIGALFEKEIDFSPMDFTPTKESREVIDFTEWVGEDPVVIVSAAPQPEIRPFLLLEIYQPSVYLSLIVTLFFCALIIWALTRANTILLAGVYMPSKVQKFTKVLLSASKTIVAQCLKDTPNELSVRIFLIMVWFMSLVVDTVYQGHITAFIAMPRYTPAIDNHEKLAKNNSVIPVTEKFSTTQTLIMESERESFKALASRLELYDASFLDTEEFYYGISVGKWAFVDSYSSTYGRALNFENRISRCKFYVSRDSVIGGLDAWPFPRNSPVHSQISRSLKWLRYYGILENIRSRYYLSTCDRSKGGDGVKKMDITMMQSSFYVAGIGWSVAATVFLLEGIVSRLMHMSKTGQRFQ
ncbi:glutamate receptor ionotropic, kainate 5-like [Penaeus japonicus]|uniref:glutamate receptor ionotropic, kainate 5-like n=1 Tax=Penaeus japonicus TaxID=27405 RepID=UPI001C70F27C|nr:glutamate receptor ionotropic, kainate 5-like [Penaeus japonicus]